MAASAVAAPAAGIAEVPTTTYQRVPCDLPGIDLWLPTSTKMDSSRDVEEELPAREDGAEAPGSFLTRVRSKMSRSRRSSSRVGPPTSKSKTSTSGRSSDVQLTDPEKEYLAYLRRSVGTGLFSHYLMSAA